MEAFGPKLHTEDYLSLMEAVFALLAYYEDKSSNSFTNAYLTPFTLQVICHRVKENVLKQSPFVIRQLFEYIGCVELFKDRKLIIITIINF